MSKFHLTEQFQELLFDLGFERIVSLSNVYMRVNGGGLFEHVLIHLVNEDELVIDDLIVHFYAEYVCEEWKQSKRRLI